MAIGRKMGTTTQRKIQNVSRAKYQELHLRGTCHSFPWRLITTQRLHNFNIFMLIKHHLDVFYIGLPWKCNLTMILLLKFGPPHFNFKSSCLIVLFFFFPIASCTCFLATISSIFLSEDNQIFELRVPLHWALSLFLLLVLVSAFWFEGFSNVWWSLLYMHTRCWATLKLTRSWGGRAI